MSGGGGGRGLFCRGTNLQNFAPTFSVPLSLLDARKTARQWTAFTGRGDGNLLRVPMEVFIPAKSKRQDRTAVRAGL